MNLDLNQKISGMSMPEYMAQLIEKNDSQQMEIERGKLSVSILKQMNNHSRLLLDAEKLKFKMEMAEKE